MTEYQAGKQEQNKIVYLKYEFGITKKIYWAVGLWLTNVEGNGVGFY